MGKSALLPRGHRTWMHCTSRLRASCTNPSETWDAKDKEDACWFASRCFILWVLLLPFAVIGGAWVGTRLGEHKLLTRANFDLSVLAWLRVWLTAITRVDDTLMSEIAQRPRLQVHFVVVLSPPQPPDPYVALTMAQRCIVEAALRAAPQVTLWVSGTRLPPDRERPTWRRWRESLRAHAAQGAHIGGLSVRTHRFHPSTAIGSWLGEQGAASMYRRADWLARGWPTHPATVMACFPLSYSY